MAVPVVARHNPGLAQHSEKPSIVHLVKSVTTYIHSVDSWTITWPLMEGHGGPVEEARRILEEEVPTVEEVDQVLEEVRRKGRRTSRTTGDSVTFSATRQRLGTCT